MLNASPDPSIVSLSLSVYRALLAFYPPRFKREYGPHMAQVFRDSCLKTYRQAGPPGLLSLWALTLYDWFKTVLEEQINRETDMTRAKFIRLSGWGLILGAVSMSISIFSEPLTIRAGLSRLLGYPRTLAEYDTYRTFSEQAGSWLFLLASLLLFCGAAGLRLRYGKPGGMLCNQSLHVSTAGGGMMFLASLFSLLVEWDGWWGYTMLGMVLLFGGLTFFGIATLQTKPMARWNGLPILAGFWFPVFILISLLIEFAISNPSWNAPDALMNGILLVTTISLILLGYILQGDASGEQAVCNQNHC